MEGQQPAPVVAGSGGRPGSEAAVDWARAHAASVGRPLVVVTVPGRPVDALVAQSQRAAVLVVGTRHRLGARGSFFGSVARAVSVRAACPVVVVPTDFVVPHRPDGAVVLGVNAGAECWSAIEWAADIAVLRGASLVVTTVFHAFPPRVRASEVRAGSISGRPVPMRFPAREEAVTLTRRAAAHARARQPGLRVVQHQVTGSVVAGLENVVEHAALIVVGTRDLHRPNGLVTRSVSRGLLHGAPCPVAVVGALPTRCRPDTPPG